MLRQPRHEQESQSVLLRRPKNPAYYTVKEITRFYGIR